MRGESASHYGLPLSLWTEDAESKRASAPPYARDYLYSIPVAILQMIIGKAPRLQVSDREIHTSAFAGSKGWVMHLANVSGTLVKPPETVNHSDVFHYFKQSAETIGNERVVPFFSTAVTLFSA